MRTCRLRITVTGCVQFQQVHPPRSIKTLVKHVAQSHVSDNFSNWKYEVRYFYDAVTVTMTWILVKNKALLLRFRSLPTMKEGNVYREIGMLL